MKSFQAVSTTPLPQIARQPDTPVRIVVNGVPCETTGDSEPCAPP